MRTDRERGDNLIGQPYNPDDERFARLLDSMWRAGHTAGWNECFNYYAMQSVYSPRAMHAASPLAPEEPKP